MVEFLLLAAQCLIFPYLNLYWSVGAIAMSLWKTSPYPLIPQHHLWLILAQQLLPNSLANPHYVWKVIWLIPHHAHRHQMNHLLIIHCPHPWICRAIFHLFHLLAHPQLANPLPDNYHRLNTCPNTVPQKGLRNAFYRLVRQLKSRAMHLNA